MEQRLPHTENQINVDSAPMQLGLARIQFANNDPALRLNQMAAILSDIKIEFNQDTWASSFSRDGASKSKLTIGGAALPPEIKSAFSWGVESKEDEILLKAAHELSHAFQRLSGLEESLVRFLSGSNDIDKAHEPYLQLYAFLAEHGKVSGLSDLGIYHEQTEAERERVKKGIALDMTLLEDVTELIAAYSISDDYFNYRLNNSHLSEEEKRDLAVFVIQTFHNNI